MKAEIGVKRFYRRLALGGLIGPLLFAGIVIVGGALRPEYSHAVQYISELGATGSSRAYLLNYLGFVPTGLLLTAFGVSLASLSPRTARARFGALLIVLFGLGAIAAGMFSCDAGCAAEDMSLEAKLHELVSLAAFLSGIIGCGVWAAEFRGRSAWRSLWRYTAFSSTAALTFLLLMLTAGTGVGLWQRLMVGTLYLWCAVAGLRLFTLTRTTESAT